MKNPKVFQSKIIISNFILPGSFSTTFCTTAFCTTPAMDASITHFSQKPHPPSSCISFNFSAQKCNVSKIDKKYFKNKNIRRITRIFLEKYFSTNGENVLTASLHSYYGKYELSCSYSRRTSSPSYVYNN